MERHPDSLWAATAEPDPGHRPLDAETSAEVCVVGGGFTGLSTALALAERGIDVVVLEANAPGWGASGRNGGQVIPGLKQDPDALLSAFGDEAGARLASFAGSTPRILFDIVRRHAIACDAFEGGWLQPAHAEAGLDTIRARAAQWRPYGADIVELDRAETARLVGSEHYVGALLDRRGGSIQPLSFARGLARAAAGLGARIHADSPATGLARRDGTWRVTTPRGSVAARRVVLATNGYSGPLHPTLMRSVVPVFSFQVATEPLSDNVAATILPEGHPASDTRRLLWYFRKDRHNRLLMGGRGFRKDALDAGDTGVLQAALRRLYPQLGEIRFSYHWGGRVAMTADHLPHLHEIEEGLFAGLGFNGRGVAMGTAMGTVLARLAAGEPADAMPLPVTPLRPIRLHGLHSPVVHALTAYYRWQDARERRAMAS
ncbi:NAD(P)/FAD-dependent oxidoreductase [Salinarimonas ramus]|uniref:FAD-dependent oxidoreductase n=1 Tax=Salinarimonas ramus TaxID=690164 RepID=A0A917QAX9_9HYPH|nr:FAD-binding oxidoreductase [Salinarimonas ramus]GGK40845.1 FAD-dependent oxidoreductase [Salinarimonas ramus]